MTATVITGAGVAGPGLDQPGQLLKPGPAAGPYDPAAELGIRGLRYKDQATRSGLLAVARALRDAGFPGGEGLDGDSTGVIVSSNLGNLDTACEVAATIGADTVSGISPMALPNASSNIIASTIAITYRLRGPNLTFCNGPTSGLDALYWASLLIAAGRAGRVIVVGAETRNPVTDRLTGPRDPAFDGAAAVVVEPASGAGEGYRLGDYARGAAPAIADGQRIDLRWLGLCSGASGVLQAAAAVAALSGPGRDTVVMTAGTEADDAMASMLVHGPGKER